MFNFLWPVALCNLRAPGWQCEWTWREILREKPGQLAPPYLNAPRRALGSGVSVFRAFQQGSEVREVIFFLQLVQDLTFDLSVRDSK